MEYMVKTLIYVKVVIIFSTFPFHGLDTKVQRG